MLDRSSTKPSDEQTELPVYNKHYNFHVSVVQSVGLISRSTSVSPTSSYSNLVSPPTDTPSPTHEKNNSPALVRESKRVHCDANPETTEDPPSNGKVVAVILFYLTAAIVMVFVNKWVLRATSLPLTFLFCQLILATAFLRVGGLFGFLETLKFSREVSKRLLPLITINVIGLVFNTYCLQHVDASFYQIARGLVLPFTVLASYLFLSSRPSRKILAAVFTVCVGFLWGVRSDRLYTSQIGIFLGVLSSLTTSVHAIIVQRSLSVTSSAIELAYYNNLVSALILLPFIPFTSEFGNAYLLVTRGGESLQIFLIGALVTGIFGFLISLAGFLSIKVTSPVTHMVSSAVRGVLQTILGAALFGDVITLDRLIGIIVILGGSLAYTTIKDIENRPETSLRRENQSSQNVLPLFLPQKSKS